MSGVWVDPLPSSPFQGEARATACDAGHAFGEGTHIGRCELRDHLA